MRISAIVLLVLLAVCCGCFSKKGLVKNASKNCNFLIDSLLQSKYVNKILGLEKAERSFPMIRIFDLSGKINTCEGFYFSKDSSIRIQYFLETELDPTMNSGHFRDLTIARYKKQGNKLSITLIGAFFECTGNINSSYTVELEFLVKDMDSIILQKEAIIELNTTRREFPDYDKIEPYEERK